MSIRVGDSNRVRSAIKDFLEKMKACDAAIPEELAEDALEMAEEVRDALCASDEEADILEVTKDNCGNAMDEEEIEAKVEDAMAKVLRKYGLVKDSSMRALDELEEEIKETDEEENTLDADNEESVTVDPDSMSDSAAAIKKFIRDMKPVIASVKDARTRRKLSDSVARFAKMSMGGSDTYSGIMATARMSAANNMKPPAARTTDSDIDLGMDIARKYNPHYKKEG